jgi:NhaP-type Na+/H+ or K+/H+ antiporter
MLSEGVKEIIKILGIISLGVIIGYFLMFFLKRIKEHTIEGFLGIALFLSGGITLTYISNDIANSLYYIGTLLGIICNICMTIKYGDPRSVFGKYKHDKH